jgi:signal transduction histidine kinase
MHQPTPGGEINRVLMSASPELSLLLGWTSLSPQHRVIGVLFFAIVCGSAEVLFLSGWALAVLILIVVFGLLSSGYLRWNSLKPSHKQLEEFIACQRAEEASILDERNRMAREIHDTLAQTFAGILLHLGAARMVKDADIAKAHIETADELARTGLAEARRSVAALRPKLLEEGDLHSALNHLATQMNSANVPIVYEVIGTAYPISPDVENHLLRIGQEALTNAIKHAQATEIRIELVYESAKCVLRIKDNGQGFEIDKVSLNRSFFGLLGINERVELIGGELTIRSELGEGTEVIVVVNRSR